MLKFLLNKLIFRTSWLLALLLVISVDCGVSRLYLCVFKMGKDLLGTGFIVCFLCLET